MQFTTILALAPLALAAPLETRLTSSKDAFIVTAVNDGSPINNLRYAIRNSGIFLGGSANTFCPDNGGTPCSQYSNESSYNAVPGKVGGVNLNARVPGGQYLFVTKDGAVGYNHPHSSIIPAGADESGFLYTAPSNGQRGSLIYTDNGASRFVACPVEGGEYQIFANIAGPDFANCIEHSAVADAYTGAPAFSYD